MSIPKERTLCIVGLAALLRLLLLGIKPPHFDEGVNGWFVDQITKTGWFHYDPTNYHGPLHFYVLFVFQTLFGRSLWVLRMPIVIVSTATVFLVLNFDRFLGRRATQLAALAMAVSPAAVFYGRYAIHESWLVFFLVLTLFGLAGLAWFGTRQYLWCVTLGLAGMILTKETYIIHVAALSLAILFLWLWERMSPSAGFNPLAAQLWNRKDLLWCAITAMGLIVFFYSGTLLDFGSLRGLYQTYAAWARTGQEGHGHEKAFTYWVNPLMLRYEWAALAGLAGSAWLLWPKHDRLMRFVAIYGCGTLVAYSIVRYKTPWCIISLLWPFYFIFGYVGMELAKRVPIAARATCGVLLAVSLGWTISLNFFHYTDEREPYVYVQTLPDMEKLTGPLIAQAKVNPDNLHLNAHILLTSYHPIPWVLGDFTGIGYYGEDRKPDRYDADFLLVESTRVEEVENALHENYFTEPLHLRSSQDESKLYFNARRFAALFPGRKPDLLQDAPIPPDDSP